jgi:glutamate racemase
MKIAPIGIFDSGFGGLTVMNAVQELMPSEDIIYFGDTANLPYGNKSAETIATYMVKNTDFLVSLGIKVLIVACHTACTAAYDLLAKTLSIPVVGVVHPSIALLKQNTKEGKIGLIGTRRTIQSQTYQKLIAEEMPSSEVISLACPLFVPIVEEGYAKHSLAKAVIKEYLSPLREKKIEALLLGCTHYPLLSSLIQEEVGHSTVLVDPAVGCAQEAKSILKERGWLCDVERDPQYTFYVSDEPEKFRSFGKNFFQHPMERVLIAPFS